MKSRSFKNCNQTYLSYEDAQIRVQELGIKNSAHYKKLFDAKKLKGLPHNPSAFYGKTQRVKISYINARILAKKHNIRNSTDWRDFAIKHNKNPENDYLPHTPNKDTWKDWTNWYDFLDKKSWKDKPPLSELKAFAKKHNVQTLKQWCNLKKPENYVKFPDEAFDYKKDWNGWDDFFDKQPITYEEGKKIVLKLKIKSYSEYTKLWNLKKLPEGMPSYPTKWKAWEKEWKGWSEFLNYNIFLEFNEAKKLLKPYKIKTIQQFKELRKTHKEIKRIPIAPFHYYKKEWTNWGDFFGSGKIPIQERKYQTYQQAQKYIKKLGIQSRKEFYEKWQELKLNEKQIPIDPERIYKKTGEWEGWTKFFSKNHNYGNFFSYEEAGRIAHKMKIEIAKDYLKLAVAHKLPKGMPRSPRNFYKKEWKGWNDFLGTVKPLSYEETSKVAQKLGIKSSKQYREYYDLGKLPKGMPRDPNIVFKRYRKGE